ncbi:MAG: hypothetical protein MRZ79_10385 [Bacteroidia bacterium]|nr:hypothetical protein [Bacteroidia bacterium]
MSRKSVSAQLIETFSDAEKKNFINWLTFRHSKDDKLIILFTGIQQEWKEEVIAEKIYPSHMAAKVNKGKMADLRSKLTNELELYMAYTQLEQEDESRKMLFLNNLASRGNKEVFGAMLKKIKKQLLPFKRPKTANYYEQKFRISLHEHTHAQQNGKDKKENTLKESSKSFDLYWIYQKLNFILGAIVYNNFRISKEKNVGKKTSTTEKMEEVESFFQEEFLEYLAKKVKGNELLQGAGLFLQLIQSIESKEFNFRRIMDALTEQVEAKRLDEEDISNIESAIHSRLVLDANSSTFDKRDKHLNNLCELYDWSIRRKPLEKNSIIRSSTYSNMTIIFTISEQFQRSEVIANMYKNHLAPSVQNELYNLAMAWNLFYQGDLEKSQKFVDKVDTTNEILDIRKRFLNFQIAYEQYEKEPEKGRPNALNSMNALYEYTRKRKGALTWSSRESMQNLARLSVKLVNAHKTPELEKLRKEAFETGSFVHKKWLIDKINNKIQLT